MCVICLLAGGAAAPGGCRRHVAGGPAPAAASPAAAPDPEHLPRFAKVDDGLYRGAQPSREGFAELKRRGVKTVVSLRVFHSDRGKMAGLGLGYFRLSFKLIHPETEDVLAFLKVATDPVRRPVFVHCQQGVDRTGMMVAIYRMVVQDWSRARAMDEMKRMGFHQAVEPIEDYIEDLDVGGLKRQLRAAKAPRVRIVR